MILKLSRARPLRRDKCKEVVPALKIRFSYEVSVLKNEFRCPEMIFSNFSVFVFEQKCHTKGQN